MSEELLEALCAACDELSLGILILSLRGRILFANLSAKAMIDRCWPIRALDGILQASEQEANGELKRIVESLSQGSDKAVEYEFCLVRSSAGQAGAIGCGRRRIPPTAGTSSIALFITETTQKCYHGINGFAEVYGLSKAETRTLKALVETQTPARAAAHLKVALSTVKSHIRKIFHKTNTARQAELLRLVEGCRTPFRQAE